MIPTRPTCPSCGSVHVTIRNHTGQCLEPDCQTRGKDTVFRDPHKQPGPKHKTPNQHFRDPVALTPEGYDE